MFSSLVILTALVFFTICTNTTQSSITATPATTTLPIKTITISPVPLAAAEIPRCLSKNDLLAAHYRDYIPLCNVDIPSYQDIFPFLWTGSFESCLAHCDAFNIAATNDSLNFLKHPAVKRQVQGMVRDGEEVRCKAALYAPGRWLGRDDCYLKWGLEGAKKTEGKIWLVGGMKRKDLEDGDGGRLSFNGTTMQGQTGTPSETKTTKGTDKMDSESTSETATTSTVARSTAMPLTASRLTSSRSTFPHSTFPHSTSSRSTATTSTSTYSSGGQTTTSTSTAEKTASSSSSAPLFDPTLPPILTLSTAYNEKHLPSA